MSEEIRVPRDPVLDNVTDGEVVSSDCESEVSLKPDRYWPLGLSEDAWKKSQDLLLPGGRRAFGESYYAKTTNKDPVTKKWRTTPFLPAQQQPFDAKAWQRHLTGKHVVGLVWPGLVNCVEFDIDRKRLEVASWESVLDRLVLVYRALGCLPVRPPRSQDGALVAYGDFSEWLDEQAEDRRTLVDVWNCGELPGILWRSSGGTTKGGIKYPGGVRLRIPLDGFYPSSDARDAFAAVLDEAMPGWDHPGSEWCVELAPHGQKNWRLPGGRGSDLIRIEDGAPMTARAVDVAVKPREEVHATEDGLIRAVVAVRTDLHRNLGLFVDEWGKAAARVVPLPQKARANRLEGRSTEGAPPLPQPQRGPGRRSLDPIANIPPPVSGAGERNDRFGRLVCGWRVGAGLSRDAVTARAVAWLSQPGHRGSLGGSSGAAVKRSMVDSIPAMLDLLDSKVESGELVVGLRPTTGGRRRSTPSLSSLFAGPHTTPSLKSYSPCFLLPGEPRNIWRKVALRYVTDADRAAITKVDDPWLLRPKGQPKLLVLVGLIRMLEELDGPLDRVRVPWWVVAMVAGTKFPKDHPARLNEFGLPRSPYEYLLAAAQAAGLLGRVVVNGQQGVTSTTYEVLRRA